MRSRPGPSQHEQESVAQMESSSIFGPLLEAFAWARHHNPYHFLRSRRMNFITIHYLYILSMTIIISILLYPAKGLDYIDALFFASGCATQSGLNTVNINSLNTYQQIVMYLMTMFCNPIFIHSSVVFVRLYWFEKRFQNIVQDARSRLRSRVKTQDSVEIPSTNNEKTVRGRNIVVVHRDMPSAALDATENVSHEPQKSSQDKDTAPNLPLHREITFADEVAPQKHAESYNNHFSPQLNDLEQGPFRFSHDQHIAIREKQRSNNPRGTLRIPGPRDFDRGQEPEPLDDEDDPKSAKRAQDPESLDLQDSPHGNEHPKRSLSNLEPSRTRRSTDHSVGSALTRRKGFFTQMVNATTHEDANIEQSHPPRRSTFNSLRNWTSSEKEPVAPYLSWQPTIGRNSAFADLSQQQREELGGIEYRSLKTLAAVLVTYFLLFHLLAAIILVPWIIRTPPWSGIVQSDGINKTWWGIFTAGSLFNDLGFTLTPDSFVSFQLAVVPLLIGTFFIIIGNTGFPCMLRLVIWIASKVTRSGSPLWEEFRFLLDHPRRCFTLLFPGNATWWLFWILVVLNGVDIVFFIILDIHDETLAQINPAGFRVLNGLFQAASTRTAGFSSVNLANLHPGIQVSYMLMMYISVFPIAISMRRTNVYEEKSLGIYSSMDETAQDSKEPSYVGAHLRRQLSFDLWYIFMGFFVIAIAEGKHIENTNEYAFTLFSVLFEIVSAYGTVGLSLGYPGVDTSFSAQFSVISKLVIISMQIRGRHRGLPYELDRAVLLPSDKLHQKETEDAAKRLHRGNSDGVNPDLLRRSLSMRDHDRVASIPLDRVPEASENESCANSSHSPKHRPNSPT